MKLVDNWKSAWRWFSIHCLWIAAAIPNVWAELPSDLKSAIPPGTMGAIAALVAICGIAGRLVDQEKKND